MMKPKDLCNFSASKLIELMKKRECSAVEVMQAHLDRVDLINPSINGLVQKFSHQECLQKAKEADQKLARGETPKKLHGLPVTIKDIFEVQGLISCVGCTGLKNRVATQDSTIVKRLKDEGAIILGITNVPELLCIYETDNDVYGRTNNPYSIERTPGGSSGGCAAMVSSGCSPLSIGTDAGGSIRWPAHCTGITAHKPTTGIVPRSGTLLNNDQGLITRFVTPGPLARYVEDLILVLPIMVGPDGIDPSIPPIALKEPRDVDPSRLRIAWFYEDGISEMHEDILTAIKALIAKLNGHVACVDLISVDAVKKAHHLLWECFFMGGDRGEGFKETLASYGVVTPSKLLQGVIKDAEKSVLSVTQYRNIFHEMDGCRKEMELATKDYDIVISPMAATTAKKHGEGLAHNKDMTHGLIYSLTGWPVTVVRCGTGSDGMPVGVQIAAKSWKDHNALACARLVESITGGYVPF